MLRCFWKTQEILSTVEPANTFWTRFRGLLGREQLSEDCGLWITPCNSIHTLGMRFPIGVVFLDANLQVCRVLPEVRPGRLSPWVPRAKSVLEVNPQLLVRYPLQKGDMLKIHA